MSECNGVIEYLTAGEALWGYEGPGWYFWDETWAYCHGPYASREEASVAVNKYTEWLETGRCE